MEDDAQFTGKYESSGRIGARLLDRFYESVRALGEPSLMPGGSVHEIGCGAGFSTERLRQWIPGDVCFSASDFGESLVLKARQRNPEVEIDQRSAYRLGLPDKSIDMLVMLEVLEHLDRPLEALQELARVARKNVLISTPSEPLWRILNMARGKYVAAFGNTPGHINHWSGRSLRHVVSPWFKVVSYRQPVPWTILLLEPRV
ncbi:class I SAM-dependent methyltransferase [Luteimonas sp. MJ204]|uniref:class I SAM-dependent methyltransferase n=1 Tax=Luteimonas sp. MJ145 TaxID=3129234 RepID=UPI0031BB4B2D